jgi:hypothetical protein
VPAGDDRVRADGRKELVAVADGFRESSESWVGLHLDGVSSPVPSTTQMSSVRKPARSRPGRTWRCRRPPPTPAGSGSPRRGGVCRDVDGHLERADGGR